MTLQVKAAYLDAVGKVKWTTALPEIDDSHQVVTMRGKAWEGRTEAVTELGFPEHQDAPLAEQIGSALVAKVDKLRRLDGLRIRYGAQSVTEGPDTSGGPLAITFAVKDPVAHFAGFDALLMVHAGTWEEARRSYVDGGNERARDYLIASVARGLYELDFDTAGRVKRFTQPRLDPTPYLEDFGHSEELVSGVTMDAMTSAEQAVRTRGELVAEAAKANGHVDEAVEAV